MLQIETITTSRSFEIETPGCLPGAAVWLYPVIFTAFFCCGRGCKTQIVCFMKPLSSTYPLLFVNAFAWWYIALSGSTIFFMSSLRVCLRCHTSQLPARSRRPIALAKCRLSAANAQCGQRSLSVDYDCGHHARDWRVGFLHAGQQHSEVQVINVILSLPATRMFLTFSESHSVMYTD